MDILIYGAGVIGTLYAGRLQAAGNRVTIVARGQRLEDIRRYGLVLDNILAGIQTATQVAAVDRLDFNARYDLAVIMVRRNQVASVIPELTANRGIPTLLFMLNNPLASNELVRMLGHDRVLLGFPGAGGTREGHIIRYAMIPQQPTMLGELGGKRTPRLRNIARAFRAAGLRTRLAHAMDAWLKAHAFFITAISGALYLAASDTRRLADDHASLRMMVQGVREGFAAVDALGLPVTPFAPKVLFTWLPQTFAVRYWRRYFASVLGDLVFAQHARSAFDEMREVANDCRAMLDRSRIPAPALRQLYAAIDGYAQRQQAEESPRSR